MSDMYEALSDRYDALKFHYEARKFDLEKLQKKLDMVHSKITRLLSEEPYYDFPNNFSNWSTIMKSCYWDGINEMKKQQTAMLMELATILEENK